MQISGASSSNELSDPVRFPYYFQLLSSEVNLAYVFYSIIKEYDWKRVALIVQNEYGYRAVSSKLDTSLACMNESILSLYAFHFVDYKCTKELLSNINLLYGGKFMIDTQINLNFHRKYHLKIKSLCKGAKYKNRL